MSIRAIIIDDEVMARTLLKGMLEEFCSDVIVVDMCENLSSGVLSIRKNKPDLVFLDIEMPEHNGLEILNFFDNEEIDFKIVFTTSYNEYAVRAFKLSAIDYLLKPIEPEELINTVLHYQKLQHSFTALKESYKQGVSLNSSKRIPIHTASSTIFIKTDDILFLRAEGAYTKLYLENDQTILASKGLKHFEELLSSEPQFLRTHKSYIANLNYVSELVKSNGGHLKIYGHEINISSDKLSLFYEYMS